MHQLKIDMLNGLSDCLSFYGQDLKRKRQSKAVQKKASSKNRRECVLDGGGIIRDSVAIW